MMKQVTKPDYSKMKENQLRLLLGKHQQMLKNKRLIDALPDKGERFRLAIAEIEKILADPSTPMDCESLSHQFDQMTMSTDEIETTSTRVFLDKIEQNRNENVFNKDFSDERLNDVKQRLKARQAQRQNENHLTSTKLISLDEAIRLYNEEKLRAEEHLLEQTTARLLGNMNLSRTTFGLPPSTIGQTYRQTTRTIDDDDDDDHNNNNGEDENHVSRRNHFARDKTENLSDHDSDEIDYPDEQEDED